MRDQRLAGIDIGTLTCRLLIADLPANGPLEGAATQSDGFFGSAKASISRND